MAHDVTIFATSSAPGGYRTILRLSGPAAWPLAIGNLAIPGSDPTAPGMYHGTIPPYHLPAMLLLFKAPRSFTGEDLAELHIPTSAPLAAMVSTQLASCGARLALPGEFTARAFFNNKMDLTQAEGIAATIAAEDQQQLRAATLLREGALHQWTVATADSLANLLALVEAGIDFSDEEGVSFISPADIRIQLADLMDRINSLQSSAVRWERIGAMPTVVFTGQPNVGKSSLINALSGSQRAIVSPIAGTTRDALSATLQTPAGPIRLVDVAGEEPDVTPIAQRMTDARNLAVLEADLVIEVLAPDVPASVTSLTNAFRILNKCDLPGLPPLPDSTLQVSARTRQGLHELLNLIVQKITNRRSIQADHVTLNQRHRSLLGSAAESLQQATLNATDELVRNFPELLATDLRYALDRIGEISGTIAPDEILGRIFGTFCIGK